MSHTLDDISLDLYADPAEIAAWNMKQFAPPPNVRPSEFVHNYRILTTESGAAEEGRYNIFRTPHVIEPLDKLFEEETYAITAMANVQSAKTVGIIENAIFHIVHNCPGRIVQIGETEAKMEKYSKTTIDSMIERNAGLKERFLTLKSRTAGSTLLFKKFIGGSYMLLGSNTPTSFSQYTAKYIFLDELDRWGNIPGGDLVERAEGRIKRIRGSKIVDVGSPTIAGASKTEQRFASGTQSHFMPPCPHCHHRQVLVFGPQSQFYRPTNDICSPQIIGGIAKGWLEFDKDNCTWAAYHCENCDKLIDERHRNDMMQKAVWQAFNPKPDHNSIKGKHYSYHFSELIFLIETNWQNLAAQFLIAKRNREKLRVWVNEKAGETFEELETASITAESLGIRRENYYSPDDQWKLPREVLVLIASCDVQINRIELLLTGYGYTLSGVEGATGRMDAWGLEHRIFDGSPEHATVWQSLDEFLQKDFPHSLGVALPIHCTFIDSGAWQERVLQYTTPRRDRYIFGIKGFDKGPIVSDLTKVGKNQEYLQIHVGKNRANQRLFQFLHDTIATTDGVEKTDVSKIHFNFTGTAQADYFEQLTNMKSVKSIDRGMPVIRWEQKDRNVRLEVNHMWAYNLAALHYRRVDWESVIRNFADAIEALKNPPKPEPQKKIAVDEIRKQDRWKL